MTYRIPGCSKPLPAGTPRDVVYFLLSTSRTHLQYSDRVFMRQFAMSFFDMSNGLELSTDHPDGFVGDLVRHGWLQQQA